MRCLKFLLLILLLCSRAGAFIIYGEVEDIGQGHARSFVDVDQYGEPHGIGIALSKDALEGLPTTPALWTLKLPSIINIPPYNHMTVNWEPHGHEPEGIYGLPHFDFHFYLISEEVRNNITCSGDDQIVCMTQPKPENIPPFYVPTPGGVPQMGWHWVDPRSPEYNGQIFTATFIYGFYDGKINFLEPMMTRDFMLERKSFYKKIPIPQKVSDFGFFPEAYSFRYDSNKKLYLITLKDIIHKDDDITP